MKKILLMCIMVFTCVVLLACQSKEKKEASNNQQEKPQEQLEEKQKVEPEEEVEEEPITASYSLIPEEMEQELAGPLFEKHIGDQLLAANEGYEKAANEAVTAYIDDVKKEETDDWDAETWANSLITQLRANRGSTIEAIKNFEVVYSELKLPDGKLLQDMEEEDFEQQAEQVDIAVLVDASGSMKADVNGGNKMKLAKESIEKFSKDLPDNVRISLSVFGHIGTGSDSDKQKSCSSIDTFYPLKEYNEKEFSKALHAFEASGWTPLAAAIEQAEKELVNKADKNSQTYIYIISDGIETCDGDPVEAAKKAKQSVTDLKINIIGFDVDDEADRQLKEVAKVSGGTYTSAKDKQQLDELVTKSWKEEIGQTTWVFWEIGNQSDINFASVQLANQLRDLQQNEITVHSRESSLLKETLLKLMEHELIDQSQYTDIEELMDTRLHVIKDYTEKLRKEKHNEIFETAEDLKVLIKDLSERTDK